MINILKSGRFHTFCVIAIATFALNIFLVSISRSFGPMYGQDEVGALSRGFHILGSAVGYPSKYYPGAGIIYFPAAIVFSLSHSVVKLWITIIAINSMLIGLVGHLIDATTRFLEIEIKLGTVKNKSFVIWLFLLPLVFSANTTFITPIITLNVFAIIALLIMLVKSNRELRERRYNILALVLLGFFGGFLHPTFTLFSPLLVLIGLLNLIFYRRHVLIFLWVFFAILLGQVVVNSGGRKLFNSVEKLYSASDFEVGYGSFSLSSFAHAPTSAAFYLMMAATYVSLEIAFFGRLSKGVKSVLVEERRLILGAHHGGPSGIRTRRFSYGDVVSILVVFGIVVTVSALRYGTLRQRADDWVYLRYVYPFVLAPAIWLVLRPSQLQPPEARRSRWAGFLLVGVALIGLAIAIDYHVPGVQDEWAWINNPTFLGQYLFAGSRVAVATLGGFLIVLLYRTKMFKFTLLLTILVTSLGILDVRGVNARGHNQPSSLVDIIEKELPSDLCVGLDAKVPSSELDGRFRKGLDVYRKERLSFLFFDFRRDVVMGMRSQMNCDDVILSYDMTTDGVLIAREMFGGLGLFLAPQVYQQNALDLVSYSGGTTRLETLNEDIDEDALRRGGFSIRQAESISKSSDGIQISDQKPMFGPYTNVKSGKYRVVISIIHPAKIKPSKASILIRYSVDSQLIERDITLDLSWNKSEALGTAEFEIDYDVQLFEIVIGDLLPDVRDDFKLVSFIFDPK